MNTNKNFGLWYYLITLAGNISEALSLIAILSFLSVCFTSIGVLGEVFTGDMPPVLVRYLSSCFTPSLVVFCVSSVLALLVPSKKDLLIIFGLVVGEDALLDTGTKLGKLINQEIDKLLEAPTNGS